MQIGFGIISGGSYETLEPHWLRAYSESIYSLPVLYLDGRQVARGY